MLAKTTEYPRTSTLCAQISVEFLNGFPPLQPSNILRLKNFTGYFLSQVDRRDRENYLPHPPRGFWETVGIYYTEIGTVSSPEEFEVKFRKTLDQRQLNIPEVMDWARVNSVWEHIMAGGKKEDIPEKWCKYLSADINGMVIKYPGDLCIREWRDIEIEQQVEIYRYVTNSYFARAVCGCLGLNYCDEVLGLLNIYQLISDCHHIKNSDEPIMSKILEEINRRCPHSEIDEVGHIAAVTGLNPLVARGAYVMGTFLSGLSIKAEWDD